MKIKIFHKMAQSFKEKVFVSEDRRKEIQYEVDTNAMGDLEYYGLIILSCIIATFGLLNNSAAVIIGAMIVAPLMNPTMGTAMGIVRGDMILFIRAIKTLAFGVILAILLSAFSSLLVPNILELMNNSEITSRSLPNILDIVIALAAGSAGAFALLKKKIASSLAGVAIAVSLMPPLSAAGIGLGAILRTLFNYDWIITPDAAVMVSHYFDVFAGSFALCFSNLVAINLSGIIIFNLFGLGEGISESRKRFSAHNVVSSLLVLVMGIVLMGYYIDSLDNESLQGRVKHVLDYNVSEIDKLAHIDGFPVINSGFVFISDDMEEGDKVVKLSPIKKFFLLFQNPDSYYRFTNIEVTILSPLEPDESFVFKMKSNLEEKVGRVSLSIRYLDAKIINIR